MTDREFDLVLFGATGFVGRLTAVYVAKAAPAGARIALAGRSAEKLTAVRDSLPGEGRSWPVIVVDATDPGEIARRAKVVVTTVGPYARYGLPLVKACAEAGTHYADLTGEPLFVRDCIDSYHETAASTGSKIVNSCGFDSIPSDLNLYLIYRKALADHTGEIESATLVATMKGGMSGGTIDSGRAQFEAIADNPKLAPIYADPYALSPDRSLEANEPEPKDTLAPASSIDSSLKGWVTTFIMAPHNSKIVRRSNGLLGWAYGKHLRYHEVMSAGSSVASPLIAAGIAGAMAAMRLGPLVAKGPGRKLLAKIAPKPGTGPSAEARANGFFRSQTFARTSSGAKYVATMSAKGDPGYAATAVMLGESGLCLAFDSLSGASGILTPATAMGTELSDRLRSAGFTIEVTRSPN